MAHMDTSVPMRVRIQLGRAHDFEVRSAEELRDLRAKLVVQDNTASILHSSSTRLYVLPRSLLWCDGASSSITSSPHTLQAFLNLPPATQEAHPRQGRAVRRSFQPPRPIVTPQTRMQERGVFQREANSITGGGQLEVAAGNVGAVQVYAQIVRVVLPRTV